MERQLPCIMHPCVRADDFSLVNFTLHCIVGWICTWCHRWLQCNSQINLNLVNFWIPSPCMCIYNTLHSQSKSDCFFVLLFVFVIIISSGLSISALLWLSLCLSSESHARRGCFLRCVVHLGQPVLPYCSVFPSEPHGCLHRHFCEAPQQPQQHQQQSRNQWTGPPLPPPARSRRRTPPI